MDVFIKKTEGLLFLGCNFFVHNLLSILVVAHIPSAGEEKITQPTCSEIKSPMNKIWKKHRHIESFELS